ncbi:hypothetical protein GE061_016792 [Apolygus lucorum]|uniref:Uncharacterized protein n=1 Tax=Apolygus lucorum TaxID=248454 RepID=A0A8S9XJA5_APOLU|nr:hypothetical protein GE061_016792 [Apolygus lucorum]
MDARSMHTEHGDIFVQSRLLEFDKGCFVIVIFPVSSNFLSLNLNAASQLEITIIDAETAMNVKLLNPDPRLRQKKSISESTLGVELKKPDQAKRKGNELPNIPWSNLEMSPVKALTSQGYSRSKHNMRAVLASSNKRSGVKKDKCPATRKTNKRSSWLPRLEYFFVEQNGKPHLTIPLNEEGDKIVLNHFNDLINGYLSRKYSTYTAYKLNRWIGKYAKLRRRSDPLTLWSIRKVDPRFVEMMEGSDTSDFPTSCSYKPRFTEESGQRDLLQNDTPPPRRDEVQQNPQSNVGPPLVRPCIRFYNPDPNDFNSHVSEQSELTLPSQAEVVTSNKLTTCEILELQKTTENRVAALKSSVHPYAVQEHTGNMVDKYCKRAVKNNVENHSESNGPQKTTLNTSGDSNDARELDFEPGDCSPYGGEEVTANDLPSKMSVQEVHGNTVNSTAALKSSMIPYSIPGRPNKIMVAMTGDYNKATMGAYYDDSELDYEPEDCYSLSEDEEVTVSDLPSATSVQEDHGNNDNSAEALISSLIPSSVQQRADKIMVAMTGDYNKVGMRVKRNNEENHLESNNPFKGPQHTSGDHNHRSTNLYDHGSYYDDSELDYEPEDCYSSEDEEITANGLPSTNSVPEDHEDTSNIAEARNSSMIHKPVQDLADKPNVAVTGNHVKEGTNTKKNNEEDRSESTIPPSGDHNHSSTDDVQAEWLPLPKMVISNDPRTLSLREGSAIAENRVKAKKSRLSLLNKPNKAVNKNISWSSTLKKIHAIDKTSSQKKDWKRAKEKNKNHSDVPHKHTQYTSTDIHENSSSYNDFEQDDEEDEWYDPPDYRGKQSCRFLMELQRCSKQLRRSENHYGNSSRSIYDSDSDDSIEYYDDSEGYNPYRKRMKENNEGYCSDLTNKSSRCTLNDIHGDGSGDDDFGEDDEQEWYDPPDYRDKESCSSFVGRQQCSKQHRRSENNSSNSSRSIYDSDSDYSVAFSDDDDEYGSDDSSLYQKRAQVNNEENHSDILDSSSFNEQDDEFYDPPDYRAEESFMTHRHLRYLTHSSNSTRSIYDSDSDDSIDYYDDDDYDSDDCSGYHSFRRKLEKTLF